MRLFVLVIMCMILWRMPWGTVILGKLIENRLTPKFPGFYVPGISIAMFLEISLCYILRNLKRSHALTVFYHRDRFLFCLRHLHHGISVTFSFRIKWKKNSEYIYNEFLSSKIYHNFVLPDFTTQLMVKLKQSRYRPGGAQRVPGS